MREAGGVRRQRGAMTVEEVVQRAADARAAGAERRRRREREGGEGRGAELPSCRRIVETVVALYQEQCGSMRGVEVTEVDERRVLARLGGGIGLPQLLAIVKDVEEEMGDESVWCDQRGVHLQVLYQGGVFHIV